MPDLADVLNDFCERMKDIFHKGFGDSIDSFCGDASIIQAETKWQLVCSVNEVSIVRLFNTSDVEIMYTPNASDKTGARLVAGGADVLDSFKGTIYARASTPAAGDNLSVNFAVFSLNVNG